MGGSSSGTSALNNILNPTPNTNLSAQSPSNINVTQPTYATPQVYQPSYAQSPSNISNIVSNLFNSGALNFGQTNPYVPQGSQNPVNVPYGLQQRPMFDMDQVGPYGGNYGQNWNPYGNNYQGWNQTWNQPNQTSNAPNVAPAPNTTGPDALQQLTNLLQNNQNNQQT